jgi:hypothetical protein
MGSAGEIAMKYVLLLLLAGCGSVFDSEDQYVLQLEQIAKAGQQFYRPAVKMDYIFVADTNAECSKRGTVLQKYLDQGQHESDGYRVGACAVLGDPCLIILPFTPTKRMVREEQLHCIYGDWHPMLSGELTRRAAA